MWRVVSCLTGQHDPRVVAFAAIVCIVGALFAFKLLERAKLSASDRRWQSLLAAGVAGGSTIWATHFVAMLAYRGAVPLLFDGPLTTASAGVAIMFCYVAFNRVLCDGRANAALATALLAVGIAVMHFVGMSALEVPARVAYDYVEVAGGLATAIALVGLAIFAFDLAPHRARVPLAALGFTLAICAGHFFSMSAMTLTPDPTVVFDTAAQSSGLVASEVTIVIALLTAVLTMVIGRDAHRLTSLVNATMEGIVIVRGNRIIDVNNQLLALIGRGRAGLGPSLADLLPDLGEDRRAALRIGPAIELDIAGPGATMIPVKVARREVVIGSEAAEVLIVRDLTERRAAQERIEHLAHHDVLTDLPNRALFHDRLAQALANADRTDSKVALLALDLDGFKAINDRRGHAAGDAVLRSVAELLVEAVRSSDTVARLGGDEFAIVQSSVGQPEDAKALSVRLLTAFAERFDADYGNDGLSVSIGIALFPDDAAEPDALTRKADVALNRAKAAGKAGWHFFRHDMEAEVAARVALERELKASIAEGQLFVVYQPQADASTGTITGFEALVRWRHPVRGIVPPCDFIPLAEECGFILQLGRWVLREACTAAASWTVPLQIAVNVSPCEFARGNLADHIETVLRETGLDPHRLEIEITESALVKDRDATLAILHRLRGHGIRIAMDDFGTGYSSLSNLHAFPFDKIKIDRSFVSNLENDTAAGTIVRAIIRLGQGLRLPITAEGVETNSQLAMLRTEHCTEVQGYFIGRPLEIASYADIVDGRIGSNDGVVVGLRRALRGVAAGAR